MINREENNKESYYIDFNIKILLYKIRVGTSFFPQHIDI